MPIILIKDADELTYTLASGSQPAFLTPREEKFLVDGGFAEWTTEQPYTGNRMRCSWLGKPSAVNAGEGAQIVVSTQVAAHTDKNGLWESNGTEWCRRALLPLAQVTAMGAGGVAAVNAAGQVVNKAGSPVSGGSALPTTTAWSTTWDTAAYKDMGSYTVTSALALVSSDTSSVRGGCTQAVLVANGSNVPTLDGTSATAYGYVNTNGARNLVQLFRAGDAKFWSCGAYVGAALSIPTAPSWPAAPTIGAAVVGSAASVTGAATGTAPITYTYQWTLDGANISGATASSYTPAAGDATHALRCVVTATNAHGSADGTSNAVTVSAAATAPDAPTGLTLGTATSTTQPLTWSAPASNGGASITDYVVQSSPAGAGTWTTFSDGTSTSTSATVTGLSASTAYDYRVAAVNSVGQGAYSSTATGSTTAGVSALRMAALTNMTESGTGPYSYTSGSGANATNTHAGAPNLSLASTADGEAVATITAMPSGFAGIGFGTTSTSGAYTSFLYLLYANSNLTGTGTYRVGLSGAAGVAGNGAATATVPAVGDRLRVRRVSTAVHLEVARSATPDTWLTIHTVTGASTAQLYPRITGSVAGSAIELTSFSGLT